jgi:hypothetical protein
MPSSCVTSSRANREASSTTTVRTPLPSILSSNSAKPRLLSIGSAPLTPGSVNSATSPRPARFAKSSIAARCRFSLSLSALSRAMCSPRFRPRLLPCHHRPPLLPCHHQAPRHRNEGVLLRRPSRSPSLCRQRPGVVGLVIWPIWFGMGFKDAAGKEAAALQARQQYLTTLVTAPG